MKKILICVGTRPNFIKVTQFKSLAVDYNLDVKLLHTGQHFDHQMSEIFFDELALDKPDIFLNATGATQIDMMADIMVKFEKELSKYRPDIVLVPGDVNSSMACALVASRNNIPIGHIESGLRSFDRTMPEEINRILIDELSDFLFVTEQSGLENLVNEGKDKDKIYFVGNTMIDSLIYFQNKVKESKILNSIKCSDHYGIMTFHRPTNVDKKETIQELIKSIKKCCQQLPIIFPLHPRTKKSLKSHDLFNELVQIKNLFITDSLGYIDFMNLVSNSKIVITDSGGIQEETTFLNIPCITVRENTERPITIELGNNELSTLNADKISSLLKIKLNSQTKGETPPLWDGKSTKRIIEILNNNI